MNQLKELREEALMTVRELAERSGVSEDTITKIENGHRKGRGVTLRKLAKALRVEPHLLTRQHFEGSPEERERLLGTVPRVTSSTDTESTNPPESDLLGMEVEPPLLQAQEIVRAVRKETGLDGRDYFNFSKNQKRVLVLLGDAESKGLTPSEIADFLGISESATCRDLAILGEHDLASCDESGVRRATPMGKHRARALRKGGYKGSFYFDDALKHVATLVKAYESVAGVELRGLTTNEVRLFYSLQESIVQSIERILATAEPPPLPKRFRPEHRAEPTNVQHQDESVRP